MLDPFFTAIATAVAAKTVEAAAKGGRRALDGVIALVRRRFAEDADAQEVLEAARQSPDDANVGKLAAAVERAANSDPDFNRLLRRQWQQVVMGPGSAANIASGAETAIQTSSVEGDNYVNHHHYYTPPQEPAATPQQVPHPEPPNVNHDQPLAESVAFLTDNAKPGPRVLLLHGDKGVGKTTLTQRAVQQVSDLFPHGHVYCDIDNYRRGETVDVVAVLRHLMRSMCPPNPSSSNEDFWPLDLNERANHWRSMTADKQIIVVLDSLDDPALLKHLKPGNPKSATIVATRFNKVGFVAAGAKAVSMTPLSEADSINLLSQFCGMGRIMAEPDAARALAALCAGRPSDLRWVGAMLKCEPHKSMAQLHLELENDGRNAAVVAAEHMVSKSIDDDAHRLLQRLACHPGGDFPAELATALNGGEPADALLRQCESAQLLVRRSDGRWWIPEATRTIQPVEQSAREAAAADILDWWQRAARSADKTVDENRLRISDNKIDISVSPLSTPFESANAALDWLENEVANLLAVQKDAFDRGWDDEVWMLEESLFPLYMQRKHPADQNDSTRRAVAAAQRIGDPVIIESRMRAMRGRFLLEQGEYESAADEMLRAVELAQSAGDRRLEASAKEFLGRVRTKRDEHREAAELYRFAIEVNLELGFPRGVALNRHFLGVALAALGNREGALRLLRLARDGFAAVESLQNEGKVLIELGRLHGEAGEFEESTAAFNAAVVLLKKRGSHYYLAKAHEARGDVLAGRDLLEAKRAWQAALEIHENYHSVGKDVERLRGKLALSRLLSLAGSRRG
ncbi:MAG: NB-ARC domain-containing protein [Stackebrandtia sp.]